MQPLIHIITNPNHQYLQQFQLLVFAQQLTIYLLFFPSCLHYKIVEYQIWMIAQHSSFLVINSNSSFISYPYLNFLVMHQLTPFCQICKKPSFFYINSVCCTYFHNSHALIFLIILFLLPLVGCAPRRQRSFFFFFLNCVFCYMVFVE